MNSVVRIALNTTPEQQARLLALQQSFAQVCNALSPMVQQTRVWNRVALHHMAYKGLRERFPAMGSQMVCNAIYSVSRAARLVFQAPGSPFHHSRFAGKPLPLLRFSDNCPVYFDRHTLSLKGKQASMYTLDGRMRFELALSPEALQAFQSCRLLEIVLLQQSAGFELSFTFEEPVTAVAQPQSQAIPQHQMLTAAPETAPVPPQSLTAGAPVHPPVPHYLMVEETA
jgi:hypothetical protein